MITRYVARTTRPMMGLVAFARAAAMGSLDAFGVTLHQVFQTSGHQLDRNEDRLHPGEGSA